jgi:hypothetical protein
MIYNQKICNLINESYQNFVNDKKISPQSSSSLHIFIVDDSNKKYLSNQYLKRFNFNEYFQINTKKLNFIFSMISIIYMILLFSLILFIISFIKNEIQLINFLTIYVIYLSILITLMYILKSMQNIQLYKGYFLNIKNKKNLIKGYDGKLKNNLIKLLLNDIEEEKISEVLLTFYHELFHFYEYIEKIPHNENNADNYASYMLNKFHK